MRRIVECPGTALAMTSARALVVIARLEDNEVVAVDDVREAMLIIDAS